MALSIKTRYEKIKQDSRGEIQILKHLPLIYVCMKFMWNRG